MMFLVLSEGGTDLARFRYLSDAVPYLAAEPRGATLVTEVEGETVVLLTSPENRIELARRRWSDAMLDNDIAF